MKCKFTNEKRWLSLLLALSLTLGCVPFGTFAAEASTDITEPAAEVTEVPSETEEVLSETTEAPEETGEEPTGETEAPTETTETTEETAEATEETAEDPILQEPHTHEYEPTVTAPTDTEQGYTTYICICGDSYVADYVDATGAHTYENGICIGCGEEDYAGLNLNGLNVLCLGDSITAGQGLTTATRWTNVLASKYNWNLTNKSQGGISLSSYYYTANGQTDVSIAKKAEVLKTMPVKPDVIIVWGGHNDIGYRYSPLGTWNDETTDSFKGALKYIAELAREYAPDATLFVLTPLWFNENPYTLKVPANTSDTNLMFVDAIYEGAEEYGWIPINMDLCGVIPFNSGLLLDNVHPNAAGTALIVEYLSTELASYGANSKKETILFNKSAVSMKPGESTTVKCVLSPQSGYSTPAFTWRSSDSAVATVDANGKITSILPGTAIVTATAPNGTSADISVSVVCAHTYESTVTPPTCTEQGYTTYTCECGDSYTTDIAAALGHDFRQSFVCARCDHVARVSVLGDSISTYAGFSLVKNAVYPNKTIRSVEDTWWKQIVDAMGARLLVNNASGGSRILSDEYFNGGGIREGNHAAYRDRCVNLHDGEEKPDVIFVFLGTNDFSYHVDSNCEKCQILLNCSECTAREDGNLNVCSKCRNASGIYSSFCNLPLGTADGVNASAEVPASTCEAYAIMLSKMKAAYPNAQIYCMGLMPRVNPYQQAAYHDHGQPTAFNAELKKVAENAGARFISLEQSVDNSASTWSIYFGDAVHPTDIGMDKISETVLTDVMGKEIYAVYSQVASSAVTLTGASWAMAGCAYEADVAALNPDLKLAVRVIMNGVDITENAFHAETGRIYIAEVNGNIQITVKTEDIFWSIGTINTIHGTDANDYKNRIRTNYISLGEGVTVYAKNDAQINVVYFDADYNILPTDNNTGWVKEWNSVSAPTAAAYIRVVARATSDANLTTEYSQNVTISCGHDHVYKSTVTAPTCTEQGYTTYLCACGDSYVDGYVDALGHSYGNWQEHTAPTAADYGENRRYCVSCEVYESQQILPLGHVSATADTLAAGETLTLMKNNIVMINKDMYFRCELDSLAGGTIRMGHGKTAYTSQYIEITETHLNVWNYYTADSNQCYSYAHGLEITDWLEVTIHKGRGKASITIATEGGSLSGKYSWGAGTNGPIFCEVEGVDLQNVDCRWWCQDFDADYWFFGDSWFSTVNSARWTTYMLGDGHTDVLLGAYGGMGAQVGAPQFEEFLKYGTPKYAIWCLGMNNGDYGGKLSSIWLTNTKKFLALCEEHGVIPILATIPTTPKVNNRQKNAWVEASGYRYIDFDLALLENHVTGEWYEGTAASDLDHPTTAGAKLLYPQLHADFPELAEGNREGCTHKLAYLQAKQPECVDGGRNAYYVCTLCAAAFLDEGATQSTTTAQMLLPPAGHSYDEGTVTREATEEAEGEILYTCTVCAAKKTEVLPKLPHTHKWLDSNAVIKECTACGHVEGGYRLNVESTEVWIDGVQQKVYCNDTGTFVQIPGTDAKIMTVYSYNDAEASDPHSQYPTLMQVWWLEFENGGYTAEYVPEFENLLQYAGASIRVTGVKGIRMITGIDKALRSKLIDGSLGYRLLEYGTAVAWASDLSGTAPVLGDGKTMSNYAYKKGVADPIFADMGSEIQYTNVLVGFTDDQLAKDLVMRPYIILEDSNGEQITIYGGCVQRSIGYIAKQNQNTFPADTKADTYIENIISKVYG